MLLIAWALFSLSSEAPKEAKEDVGSLEASIFSQLPISPEIFPIRNWKVEEPKITAQSAIVMSFKSAKEQGSILFKSNINQVLPIASLTKIMTAIIALENFAPDEVIKISKNSVLTLGDKGGLIRGEELTVKDLLYIMLMESSNDAAMALASDNPRLGYYEFLDLMNSKAQELELEDTFFLDPVGLNSKNKSTVLEMAYLTNHALSFSLIWQILKTSELTIYSIDNKFSHDLLNTNELLEKISFLKGGKTGYTEEAGECMLTVSDISSSFGSNYLITVVLNSQNREQDTEKLINWSKQAWIFSP
jgi:D-alanyl-D-alanine carboxypeptidase (penicillin-binding protein 5/6)